MSYFTFKNRNKNFYKLIGAIFAVVFLVAILPIFLNNKIDKVYAETERVLIELESLGYNAINGNYSVKNKYFDHSLMLDGNAESSNSTPIYSYHDQDRWDQNFTFYPTWDNAINEYVYEIKMAYTGAKSLDIAGGSAQPGAGLQIFEDNDTDAQRFVIKKAYQVAGSQRELIGYVFFTKSSNYELSLAYNGFEGQITQEDNDLHITTITVISGVIIPPENPNTKYYRPQAIWNLEKEFEAEYASSQIMDVNDAKQYKGLVPDYYGHLSNDYDYAWYEMSNFLQVDEVNYNQPVNFNSEGLAVYLNEISFSIKDKLYHPNFREDVNLNNDFYGSLNNTHTQTIDGEGTITFEVGYGALIINKIQGQDKVPFRRHNNSSTTSAEAGEVNFLNGSNDFVSIQDNVISFDEVGIYEFNYYYSYKIEDDAWPKNDTIYYYFKRSFMFEVVNPSSMCEVYAPEHRTDDSTNDIAGYEISIENSQLKVNYTGSNDAYDIDGNIILSYLTGVKDFSQLKNTNSEAYWDFYKEVKKYGTYKVYFTNSAFYLSRLETKYIRISEAIQGPVDVKPENYPYSSDSDDFVTDGIYHFHSINEYSETENYYRVYMQSYQATPILRNVSYVRQDLEGKVQNYCLGHALLETSTSFPADINIKVSYTDLASEEEKIVGFENNTIIYNTGSVPTKYQVNIDDIFGNKIVQNITIYPEYAPSIINNELIEKSLPYSYKTRGYKVPIYNEALTETIVNGGWTTVKFLKPAGYYDHVFATRQTAYEYVLDHIFNFESYGFKMLTENDDVNPYMYTLNYNPSDMNANAINFESNIELMTYINNLLDQLIEEVVILPEQLEDYMIVDKSMYEHEIYLQKDFNVDYEAEFLLFESFKIDFEYYSAAGDLLKQGTITHTGENKYEDSMFMTLADGIEENWEEGYVKFKEYNISATMPTEYVGYVKVEAPVVQVKTIDKLVASLKVVNENESITTQEFCISDITKDSQAVVKITKDDEITYYNVSTITNKIFNEEGTYFIDVYSRNNQSVSFEIYVYNLNDKVAGVENFGATNEQVVYTGSSNSNVYVNGQPHTTHNNYVYTFSSGVNRDVVIEEDGIYFCFKQQQGSPITIETESEYEDYDYSLTNLKSLYLYESIALIQLQELENSLRIFEQDLEDAIYNVSIVERESDKLSGQNLQADLVVLEGIKAKANELNEIKNSFDLAMQDQVYLLNELNKMHSNIFVTEEFLTNISGLGQAIYNYKASVQQLYLDVDKCNNLASQISVVQSLIELLDIKSSLSLQVTDYKNSAQNIQSEINLLEGVNLEDDLIKANSLKVRAENLYNSNQGIIENLGDAALLINDINNKFTNTYVLEFYTNVFEEIKIQITNDESQYLQTSVLVSGNVSIMTQMQALTAVVDLQKAVKELLSKEYPLVYDYVPSKVGSIYYFISADEEEARPVRKVGGEDYLQTIALINEAIDEALLIRNKITQHEYEMALIDSELELYDNVISILGELKIKVNEVITSLENKIITQ